MFDLVTRDIKFISGVGPQKAAVLNKELEIYSLHDLIYYFPYKYDGIYNPIHNYLAP